MKKLFLTLTMLLFAFTGVMRASAEQGNVRADQVIEQGFEDGLGDWTMNHCHSSSGPTNVYGGNTGNYAFRFYYTANYPQYLISPELDDNDGVNFTFYAARYSSNFPEKFMVGYSSTTNDPTEFTWGSEVTCTTLYGAGAYEEYSYDFPAGTKYVSIACTSNDQFYLFVDDITLSIMTSGGGGEPKVFATTPDVLDLGYRPNGAWMAPYTFAIKSKIGATTINALDFSGNYFTYNAELPAEVGYNQPLNVELTTGTAAEGLVESTMTIMYSANRDIDQHRVTAYAYNPVDGDVWETAIDAEFDADGMFLAEAPLDIYKNYNILGASDTAVDAVYKLTFEDNVMFSAGTSGLNGVVALYNEDFEGVGGPDLDNFYTYEGPEVAPGPIDTWFSYSYTGSNTFFGTSAGGGMIYGYKITPAQLQELGLGNCAITTVEAAAREGSYYDLVILKGGDTPDLDNIVYYQSFEDFEPYYYFDVNLDEPQFLGDDENLWIMFSSDSPYAAYCGRYPVDTQNGKIWYTTDQETWLSNTTYTPEIYTRFLELPTGREVTVNLADMKIRESKPTNSELATIDGTVNGTSKMHASMSKGANHSNHRALRGNRDEQTILEEGFEGGSMPTGWTQEGPGTWTVGSGDYSTSTGSNTGTYNALIMHSTTGNVTYLITPEMDLSNAVSASLSCYYVNRSWAGDYDVFGIYYRVNGGAWNELFTTTSYTGYYYQQAAVELEGMAANYQIGFKMTDHYGYGVALDDILITADIQQGGDTPGGDEPDDPYAEYYSIEGLYVPAGTYYLVAAADDEAFPVYMKIEDIAAAEQAYLVTPSQDHLGDNNGYDNPMLLEWELGAYTTQMQVLFGTQYPPTDVLIDWTDELVAGTWAPELEHNRLYFIQVNVMNAAGEITYGEIVGFTTVIDGVEDFAVANDELYPGDAAEFHWTANARALQGYMIYMDGEKLFDEPVTGTSFSFEGLEYNLEEGSDFQIAAVYNIGRSELSEPVTVYMTGYVTVSGHVYDIDTIMPLAGATVTFVGTDEYGMPQVFTTTTDEDGAYELEVLAGVYTPYASADGFIEGEGEEDQEFAYDEDAIYEDVDIYTHEFYAPLGQIIATEQVADNNVLVEWNWTPSEILIDFETGDFSQADFVNDATYPWTVVDGTNGHSGKVMKSGNGGVSNSTSTITMVMDVPADGTMSFDLLCLGEGSSDSYDWDNGSFYLDDEQMFRYGAHTAWEAYTTTITEGVHTFTWKYKKDSSVDPTGDYFMIDNILFSFGDAKDADRSLVSYNLFRRNVVNGEELAEVVDLALGLNADVYSYIDNEWADLPYGEYQWGIQATYEGYATPANDRNRDVIFEESFENGIGDWTLYNCNSQSGVNTANGHTGTNSFGFHWTTAPSQYLISPAFTTTSEVSLSLYYKIGLGSYPENFNVGYSTTTNDVNAFTFGETVNATSLEWAEYTTTLPAGTKYIAIKSNAYDAYYLYIDDIVITGEGGGQGGDTPVEPGEMGAGLSDTIWSNILDKNMDAQVLVNVALNSGENAEGTIVTFSNSEEEFTETVDLTGSAEFTTFRKGFYALSVERLGFYTYNELVEIDEDYMVFDVVLEEIVTSVVDLYVSPTGWAVWDWGTEPLSDDDPENPDDPDEPVEPGQFPTEFMVDFEDGMPEGWTTIDADGDGYDWVLASQCGGIYLASNMSSGNGHDGSNDFILSGSYSNIAGVLTPDNYLASPLVSILDGSTFSFYACAQDATYPAEHYAVCVLPAGADNWTTVQEWTMTSKDSDKASVGRGGQTRAQGNWYYKSVDLSAYAGQQLYIAIRHFNCTDQFLLDVDDIQLGVINKGNRGNREPLSYKVKLDGVFVGETPNTYYQHDVEGMEEGSEHVTAVAPVYATGMPMIDDEIVWEEYTWTYVSCENFEGVDDEDLIVTADEDMVTITWNGEAPVDPQPQQEEATYTFDDNTMQGWTTIDDDEDDFDWMLGSQVNGVYLNGGDLGGSGHNASADLVVSGSYSNLYGPLEPDNYLVSPEKKAYTHISFWACGQDATYAAEHFGVFYSTGSNTNANDFVEVQSWTMTAKGEKYDGPRGQRAQGTWRQYEVELPGADGDIWVAIRHFNCSDMFLLDVDDITLTWGGSGTTPVDPTPGPGEDFVYNFDNGMEGWTSLDDDEDDYGWILGSECGGIYLAAGGSLAGYGHNSSADLVVSGSYSNVVGALEPDNYLVSPEKKAYTHISFWACAQDGSYAAEHFGVFYSTGSNTNANDFVEVDSWTLTAKGERHDGPRGQRQGVWYQFEADLPGAAGDIWVAIRHFNCTDQFLLDVDDITLSTGAKSNRDGQWYYYDDGEEANSFGMSGNAFSWAVLFPAGTYQGNTVSKLAIYDSYAINGSLEIYNDGTDAPANLVGSVNINTTGVEDFVEFELTEPASIDPTKNLWIVANYENGGQYPAAASDGDGDYSLLLYQGTWYTMSGMGYYYDFMIRAYIEDGGTPGPGPGPTPVPEGVIGYAIFRDGELLDVVDADVTSYVDGPVEIGEHEYCVRVVYGGEPDVTLFAMSCPVCKTMTWDGVEEQEIVERLYPNPTRSTVTIEAQDMNRITVVNSLGQVVYDAAVAGDQIELNLGRYNAGLYLVRVSTANGVSVKRVTVVR